MSEGLPEGSEGLSAMPEAMPERPVGLLVGLRACHRGLRAYQEGLRAWGGWIDLRTDRISDYSTGLCPNRAAAQKKTLHMKKL